MQFIRVDPALFSISQPEQKDLDMALLENSLVFHPTRAFLTYGFDRSLPPKVVNYRWQASREDAAHSRRKLQTTLVAAIAQTARIEAQRIWDSREGIQPFETELSNFQDGDFPDVSFRRTAQPDSHRRQEFWICALAHRNPSLRPILGIATWDNRQSIGRFTVHSRDSNPLLLLTRQPGRSSISLLYDLSHQQAFLNTIIINSCTRQNLNWDPACRCLDPIAQILFEATPPAAGDIDNTHLDRLRQSIHDRFVAPQGKELTEEQMGAATIIATPVGKGGSIRLKGSVQFVASVCSVLTMNTVFLVQARATSRPFPYSRFFVAIRTLGSSSWRRQTLQSESWSIKYRT
jgi:hypothetical protein